MNDGSRKPSKPEKVTVTIVSAIVALLILACVTGIFIFVKSHFNSADNYTSKSDYPAITVTSTGKSFQDADGGTLVEALTPDQKLTSLYFEETKDVPSGTEIEAWVVPQDLAPSHIEENSFVTSEFNSFLSPELISPDLKNLTDILPMIALFLVAIGLLGLVGVCYGVIFLTCSREYAAKADSVWFSSPGHYWHQGKGPFPYFVWVVMCLLCYAAFFVLLWDWSTPPEGGLDKLRFICVTVLAGLSAFIVLVPASGSYDNLADYVYGRVSARGVAKIPAVVLDTDYSMPPWLAKRYSKLRKDEETIKIIGETFEGSIKELCEASLLLGPEAK